MAAVTLRVTAASNPPVIRRRTGPFSSHQLVTRQYPDTTVNSVVNTAMGSGTTPPVVTSSTAAAASQSGSTGTILSPTQSVVTGVHLNPNSQPFVPSTGSNLLATGQNYMVTPTPPALGSGAAAGGLPSAVQQLIDSQNAAIQNLRQTVINLQGQLNQPVGLRTTSNFGAAMSVPPPRRLRILA